MKKNLFKSITFACLFISMPMFLSCEKEDDTTTVVVTPAPEPESDIAATLAGNWVGKMDRDYTYYDCYVTLTRLSKNVVRLEKLVCEGFNIDLKAYNLQIIENGSSVTLYSDIAKIEGHYYGYSKNLTLNVKIGSYTYYYNGYKE